MKISHSHTTPQFEKDFITLPKTVRQKAERGNLLRDFLGAFIYV
jgi:hypothetical protein